VLTSDLVRARKTKDAIVPRWLDEKTRARVRPIAAALLDVHRGMIGARRSEIDAAVAGIDVAARDRPIAEGLRKLCEDRAEFATPSGDVDPERVRAELFSRAAKAHREVSPGKRFDREPIVREVAALFSIAPEAIDDAMFADLARNQRLLAFDPLPVEALLDRYDVGLVQALLLRARHLDLSLEGAPPVFVRRLFRAARFFGLLHTATRTAAGHRFRFDGPMSLFEGGQRYGIKLASFFPRVLESPRFVATAEILHGPARTPLVLRVDHATGLKAWSAHDDGPRPEIEALVRAFEALESDWSVAGCNRVVSLPGEEVCAPDLVFSNRATGEEVLLELFGFWSRDAVFRRVESVAKGFPGRILLAVGKHLRVSEELLDERAPGENDVFKTAISAKEVLARHERRGPSDPVEGGAGS
jgi:predicted nuclease of restriction endonuclease-like RecB superfamily